ncbi:unnamed protein product, partial [Iphiclides podalirius]
MRRDTGRPASGSGDRPSRFFVLILSCSRGEREGGGGARVRVRGALGERRASGGSSGGLAIWSGRRGAHSPRPTLGRAGSHVERTQR